MVPVLKFAAYLAAVVIGGCLLAPLFFWAGEFLVEWIPPLKGVPFARYFNRAILVVALCLLWPALRWMGVRSRADLGLEKNTRFWADVRFGIALSVGGVAILAALMIVSGSTAWREPFPWHHVLGALATGVAVGIMEEVFFRGALFGVFRRHLNGHPALLVLSLFFALLHFLKPHRAARQVVVEDWLSGFDLLPYALHQFKTPELLLTGLFTLFVFGWILGYMVLRTRSLAISIALHGGWVFALRGFNLSTSKSSLGLPWIGSGYTSGVVPLLLLLTSLAILHLWVSRTRTSPEGTAPDDAEPTGPSHPTAAERL